MENEIVFDIISSLSLQRDLKKERKIYLLSLASPVLSITSAAIREVDKITASPNQE